MDKLKLIEAILEANCEKSNVGECVSYPWKVGECWFFRTVTHHQVGRIRAIYGKFVVLDDVSWVADDGPFFRCLSEGTVAESEQMPNGSVVNTDALSDAAPWNHPLPKGVIK